MFKLRPECQLRAPAQIDGISSLGESGEETFTDCDWSASHSVWTLRKIMRLLNPSEGPELFWLGS
jgi:hypothetical protein